MSSYQWMTYWPELIAEGLLDEEAGAYNTTDKGQAWLKAHEKLEEMEEVDDDYAVLLPRSR